MTKFQKFQLWALPLAMTLVVVQVGISVAWAFSTPGAALPANDTEAFDLFGTLWNFMVTKQYAASIGPGLTLAVWALKKYDTKIPKVGAAIDKFLDQPLVSFFLPTVAAAIGALVTSLATGHSFIDSLGAVWAASSAAIVTYIGLKKAGEQMNAGTVAAAAVDTKAEAIEELKK